MILKSFIKIETKNEVNKGIVITSLKWYKNQSYFQVSLNEEFMPFIEQLKEHYTKVDLNSVCSFKSKYNLVLYKFLSSWSDENKNSNQRYITTKELKKLLGLSINDYVYKGKFNRAHFERRILNPLLKDINEKTNLILSFKKNYKHGKVQNYEFTWIQKEKSTISKKSKKQVSIFDLEKENQKQQNLISQEQVTCMLNNIDKDSQVIFDN